MFFKEHNNNEKVKINDTFGKNDEEIGYVRGINRVSEDRRTGRDTYNIELRSGEVMKDVPASKLISLKGQPD
jgi:hypothetical protein